MPDPQRHRPTSSAPSWPLPLPPWRTSREWSEAVMALWQPIGRRPAVLGAMRPHAERIRDNYRSVFAHMDAFCAATCPGCREVCCALARVWYDPADLLFLLAMDQPLPPGQPIGAISDRCRYLTATGCALPRMARPWPCTRFMCRPQLALIRRKGRAFQAEFEARLAIIETERDALFDAFADAATSKQTG